MKQKSNNGLPPYSLQILNHSYPFRHSHITKAFDIKVYQDIQLANYTNILQQTNGHQQCINEHNLSLHSYLNAYSCVGKNMLVAILGVEKQKSKIRMNYEYVQTPLAHYIKYNIWDKIQLKMQKLIIEIRELAHQFVTKRINALDAICVNNIGVKSSSIYRQSLTLGTLGPSRQLVMPDFKVFLDFSQCKPINGEQETGRMVIEVDKKINSILRKQIDELIEQAYQEQSQNNKNLWKVTQLYGQNIFAKSEQNSVRFKTQNEQIKNSVIFTKKKKRKRQNKQSNNQQQNIHNKSSKALSYSTIHTSYQQNTQQKIKFSQINTNPKQISLTINKLVQKSRKNLQKFKQKYKKQNQMCIKNIP